MQAEATPQRKWGMRRVEAGDYLLWSNDRTVLWRICRGDEPGDDEALTLVSVWQLWRWLERPARNEAAIGDSIIERDWSQWELCASFLGSRREAVDEAMRLGGS